MKSSIHSFAPAFLGTALVLGLSFSNHQLRAQTPCHPDFAALMAIYNSTGGAGWTNNAGWVDGAAGTNCDPCSWYGVNCTDGRVTQLYLDGNHLVGTIPDEIGNLIPLRYIGMQQNELSGTIPATIGNLTSLSGLDLNVNQLTGTIPPVIATISSLLGFGVYSNQLTGTLPAFGNLTNLLTLNVSDNQLTGPIPPLNNLTNLVVLGLSTNQLTGPLPELGNLTNLSYFGAGNNQLSGCIPASYIQFCNGTYVYLGGYNGIPTDGDFAAFCANGTGADADADGYCAGTSPNTDCQDNNNAIHPNATEFCNGVDDDCDGFTDEACVNPMTVSAGDCQAVYFGYAPMACTTLHATVTGGAAPYAFNWSNGMTGASIQVCPTASQTYTVTVMDAAGNQANDGVNVVVVDVRCGNNNKKVMLCHSGVNTLCAAPNVVSVHLAHGDRLGACGLDPCAGGQAFRAGQSTDTFRPVLSGISLVCYPNPASTNMNVLIEGEAPEKSIFEITDFMGKTIQQKEVRPLPGEMTRLDLSGLAAGSYLLKLSAAGKILTTERFVVVRE